MADGSASGAHWVNSLELANNYYSGSYCEPRRGYGGRARRRALDNTPATPTRINYFDRYPLENHRFLHDSPVAK